MNATEPGKQQTYGNSSSGARRWPVSQEISPLGQIVTATKFPRIYGHCSITERRRVTVSLVLMIISQMMMSSQYKKNLVSVMKRHPEGLVPAVHQLICDSRMPIFTVNMGIGMPVFNCGIWDAHFRGCLFSLDTSSGPPFTGQNVSLQHQSWYIWNLKCKARRCHESPS